MEEKELRQYFKDHFDGYINTIDESVVLAMDEDGFIKAVQEIVNRRLESMKDVLPEFLYEDESQIKVGVHGDTMVTTDWYEYLHSLKIKTSK